MAGGAGDALVLAPGLVLIPVPIPEVVTPVLVLDPDLVMVVFLEVVMVVFLEVVMVVFLEVVAVVPLEVVAVVVANPPSLTYLT
jgi:hypothetical protein